MSNQTEQEFIDAWPNCSVPDCEFKVCLGAGRVGYQGDKCAQHMPAEVREAYNKRLEQEARDE